MPRGPRLDAPGAIHHITIRGVDRRAIFLDEADGEDFLARLDRLVPELGFVCFAWALMGNHAHLVLRTGPVSVSRLMARVGTGYAGRFNRRHDRVGHLIQNRFGSRLVEDEADLRNVVTYANRNPLAAGIVGSEAELARFAWSGHGALVGERPARPFESPAQTLALFAAEPRVARARVREWVARGDSPRNVEASASRHGPPREPLEAPCAEATAELMDLVRRVCSAAHVAPAALHGGRREGAVSRARAEIAYRATRGLGIRCEIVSRLLGVSASGASRAATRFERGRRRPKPSRSQ